MAYIQWNRFSQLEDSKIYCSSKCVRLVFPSDSPPLPYGLDMSLYKDSPTVLIAIAAFVHVVILKSFGWDIQNFGTCFWETQFLPGEKEICQGQVLSCMVCGFWACHPGLGWDSSYWFVSLKRSNSVPLSDTIFDLIS